MSSLTQISLPSFYELVEVDDEVKEAEFNFVVMFYVGEDEDDLHVLDIHVLLTTLARRSGGRREVRGSASGPRGPDG